MNPLALLSGVPIKVWFYLAILAGIASCGLWIHHKGYSSGVSSMQAKVDAANLLASQAEAANQSAASTISAIQASQAQCEAGRLADQVAATKAVADHDAAAALIHQQLVADKAKIQALFDKQKNADCASWSQQAACTP